MKTYRSYFILVALGLIQLSCKDDMDMETPVLECNEILVGWNLTSYAFPETPAQRDLFFLSNEVGFSVGNVGIILQTLNGGQSWKYLHAAYSQEAGYIDDAVTDAMLYCIYFINDSVGFVGGDDEDDYFDGTFTDAVFLRTRDGGKSWTKVYLEGISKVNDLIFFDELNGIGLFYLEDADYNHRYQVRTTTDGGYHWTEVVLPESTLLSRSFVTSPSKVMVVAENNLNINELWSSGDMGMTWQSTSLPGKNFSSIYFINDMVGLADCTSKDFANSIYQTRDGGATWVELETPFYGWSLIHFNSELEGFVINPVYDYIEGGGELHAYISSFEGYQTYDGGSSWDRKEVRGSCGFEGLHYSPSNSNLYFLDNQVFFRLEKP